MGDQQSGRAYKVQQSWSLDVDYNCYILCRHIHVMDMKFLQFQIISIPIRAILVIYNLFRNNSIETNTHLKSYRDELYENQLQAKS